MKAVSNINGNQKTTSYADKFYYRDSPSSSYTKLNRAFFRDISVNPNAPFIQFYQYDNTPPVITVTSSAADTINQQYTLTGTIKDIHSGLASATVNGTNLSVVADNFSKNFILSGNTGMPGVNNFTINATDKAGNSSSVTVSVNYINQKNNSNTNWSNIYKTTKTVRNNKNEEAKNDSYYVIIDGVSYMYRNGDVGIANYDHDGGGYNDAWCGAGLNVTIPLPKGISYAYFSGGCDGSNDVDITTGGNIRFTIKDTTTNEVLATDSKQTNSGSLSIAIAANITVEQSMHNLVLEIVGNHSGGRYQNAFANCGLSASGGWSFSYY